MKNGIVPSLLNVPENCRILDIQDLVLLEAKCILAMTYQTYFSELSWLELVE